MARNHHRAAFLLLGGHGERDDVVERRDHAVDAAAVLRTDHGIQRRREHVARADHVGAAEEHDAVAVRVRGGLVQDLDGLTVEVEVLLRNEERVGGPRRERRRRRLPAHAREHVLVRDHRGADAGVRDRARHVAARDRAAGRRDLLVAADVVRMHVRVDHVADRLVAELHESRRAAGRSRPRASCRRPECRPSRSARSCCRRRRRACRCCRARARPRSSRRRRDGCARVAARTTAARKRAPPLRAQSLRGLSPGTAWLGIPFPARRLALEVRARDEARVQIESGRRRSP